MNQNDILYPHISNGRYFFSPILGCSGACCYCYLPIRKYYFPRKNKITIESLQSVAQKCDDFTWGRNGTIISIGAWGDIFPLRNNKLIQHSVQIIKDLLTWENPIQIMSKNFLSQDLITEIAESVKYAGQLLYSTTITTVEKWSLFEPGTSSPITRLSVCKQFHQKGISTNVLIKPFIPKLAGIEIEHISKLLIDYQIDYCTLGIMYLNSEISHQINKNKYFNMLIDSETFSSFNHLDCEEDSLISSTEISDLLPIVDYLRNKGICAFLKSSCVNSNLLHRYNLSNYYEQNSPYCIHCGNCASERYG